MDDSDIQAIIAVFAIIAITLLVNPGLILPLDIYLSVFLLILAYFGIQTLYFMQKLSIRDLLPGILTNQEIVGFTGIGSITWLFLIGVMPEAQYMALLTMILTALGIMYLHSHSLAK